MDERILEPLLDRGVAPRQIALPRRAALAPEALRGDGRFVLDLPPGRYRLTAVSERAAPVSLEVTAETGAVQAPPLMLDETAWVAVQHKNKYGKDYPAASYPR